MSGFIDAVKKAQKEGKRDGLLDWLCKVDPSEAYNTARDKHTSRTSDWLIRDSEDFKNWEKSASSLLWLHGKPGSGKSFLSSSVISHLKERLQSDPGITLAYFFFSFSDQQKQKVDTMLASLVKQLYASRPDRPQPVERLRDYKARGERPDTKTLEATLSATTGGFSSTFIVIDALDECPTLDRERSKLMASLARIINSIPDNVHILCTSRPEPDIVAVMRNVLSAPSITAIDSTKYRRSLNHDIGLYIDSMLASTACSSWPSDLKDEARVTLIDKADGMFQYVSSQCGTLQSLTSLSLVRRELRGLPFGLDQTYDRLLLSLDPVYQIQSLSLLKWLAASTRVLKLEELAEIFILRPEHDILIDEDDRLFEPADCIKYLSSLVVTQERYHCTYVRLAHFTVKEYLMSERIAKGPAACFFFTDSDANLHIAHTSLTYQLHASNVSWEVYKGKFALAEYAVRNRASHLELLPRERWSADVACLATRALTMRSESLALMTEPGGLRAFDDTWFDGNVGHASILDYSERPYAFTARHGFLKLTEMLLSGGPGTNPYLTQQDMDATLSHAAFGGNIGIVELLLDKGAGLDVGALQAASYKGDIAMVTLLLAKGAEIDAQHSQMGSALQAAMRGNQPEVAKLLASRGTDINAVSSEAGCALMSAMSPDTLYDWGENSTACLRFLLDKGVDVNRQHATLGTALHHAAVHLVDKREHFHLLLQSGADVNIPGGQYGNPLQAMCQNINAGTEDVKRLLDMGANVNAQGGEYGTALRAVFAARGHSSRTEMAKILLDRGADINLQRGSYGTALQSACTGPGVVSWEPVRDDVLFLLQNGADVNIQGGYYGNALQAACRWASTGFVRLLLDYGADVNLQGGRYGNALQAAACRWAQTETVRLLVDHGANVNCLGGEFGTALQAAAWNAGPETLKLLLGRGADVHEQCGRYGNALQAASLGQNIDKVRILLDHGADVNAEGGQYGTALQAACASRNSNISRLLIERGANAHIQGGMSGSAWHAASDMTGCHDLKDASVTTHLQLLLDCNVDINDPQGRQHGNALQAALEARCEYWWPFNRIRFLLDHGANVNTGGGTYGSPLQSACAYTYYNDENDCERTKFLLENCSEIDVNASGGFFGSALQAAAHSRQTGSVCWLLDKGANINARGGRYGCALNAAVLKGYWEIVDVLLERGAKPDSQQLPQLDEEWLGVVQITIFDDLELDWTNGKILAGVREKRLARVRDEAGRGAVQRYRKFWEKTRDP